MLYTYTHTERNIIQSVNNEILPCATTWRGLEGIKLSERCQAEEDKCHVISLTAKTQKANTQTKNELITETNNRQWQVTSSTSNFIMDKIKSQVEWL